MKRQTRPFPAETANPDKRAQPAARPPLADGDDWIEAFPDDLPERDIYADLAEQHEADAVPEADATAGAPEEPIRTAAAEAPDAASPAPAARAGAAEAPAPVTPADAEEPQVGRSSTRPRRARRTAGIEPLQEERPLEPAGRDPSREAPSALRSREASPAGPGEPSAAPVGADRPGRRQDRRRQDRRGPELPRGQRWKERRLPRICWDR